MRAEQVSDPMPRIHACVRDGIPRCPLCLAHTELSKDLGRNDKMFYDCASCSVRVKIWAYSPGDGSWSFMRYLRRTDPNRTYVEEVER